MIQEFAQYNKDLIGKARDVAVTLRSGYISTLHFFLADCLNEETPFGIRSFLFPDQSGFQQYFDALMSIQHYYSPDYRDPGNLPLLKEAESAIMEAAIEQQKFGHAEMLPAHLFLAAIRDAGSELNYTIHPKDDLYDRLVAYYIHSGLIAYPHPPADADKLSPGFSRKLKQLMESAGANPGILPLRLDLRRLGGYEPGDQSLSLQGDTKTLLDIENMQQKQSEHGVYAVMLGERRGNRKLMIELTGFEAQALASTLEQLSTDRPRTHRLLYDVCLNLDYQLKEVILYGQDKRSLQAQIHLIKSNKILIQEMRTVDALIMAAMSHAPIFIAEKVFRMLAFIPS